MRDKGGEFVATARQSHAGKAAFPGRGQPSTAVGERVTELFADEGRVVQVVFCDDEFVAAGAGIWAGD